MISNVNVGSGEVVLRYIAQESGRWETSDGLALRQDAGGKVVAYNCHYNQRLRTQRQSFQLHGQASMAQVQPLLAEMNLPKGTVIQCSDGKLTV